MPRHDLIGYTKRFETNADRFPSERYLFPALNINLKTVIKLLNKTKLRYHQDENADGRYERVHKTRFVDGNQ